MGEVNVAFASTGYGPLWAPAVSSWLRTVGYTARHFAIQHIGQIGGAGVSDRTYTHQAENRLVREMLSDKTFTHIFMTESDMILPHDAIVKLIALDKDMASGVYFLRADKQENAGQPCLFKRPRLSRDEIEAKGPVAEYLHSQVHLFPTDKPFRVDCAGLGCILIKREVFETRMPEPWFDLKADSYGSDIYFSKNAKDLGIELWADPTVLCGQIDYYETTIDDWHWQLKNDPTFAARGFIIGHGE